MGAWDAGIFDDDTAYDWFDEIRADAVAFFRGSFEAALTASYVDYELGHRVTVSAAYIDNRLNGTQFRNDNHELDDITNVNNFERLQPNSEVSNLVASAVASLHRVLAQGSELNELWAENTTLYPVWRKGLLDVVARLEAHS